MDFSNFIKDNVEAGKSKEEILQEVTKQINQCFYTLELQKKSTDLRKQKTDFLTFAELVGEAMENLVDEMYDTDNENPKLTMEFSCEEVSFNNPFVKDYIFAMKNFFTSLSKVYIEKDSITFFN